MKVRIDKLSYWITLGRSFFAMALGIAILFYPDKARPLLGNFIGGFWIAGSLVSLRWGFSHDRSRLLTIFVALFGALAGLGVVGRGLINRWVPDDTLTILLAAVAIFTGLLHVSGYLQVNKFTRSPRTRSGIILGVFEIVLGIILLSSLSIKLEDRPLLSFITVAWALVGGIIIFLDALEMRRGASKQ
ncbi:MAG: DUF308 domain-containing protein [Candidatus Promineifilaceae bacterium]